VQGLAWPFHGCFIVWWGHGGGFESGGGVSYLASSWMLDQVQISIDDIT